MIYTRYRNLTTKELIEELRQKATRSPIIGELVQRLELTYRESCPVCDAFFIDNKEVETE